MPRRVRSDSDPHADRWVISYADFITLLFALFVVMYALSSVNEEKYRQLSAALSDVFVKNTESSGTAVPANDNAVAATAPAALADDGLLPDQGRAAGGNFAVLQQQLQQRLEAQPELGRVSLGGDGLWLELELDAALLFSSGSATPSEDAELLLEQLVQPLLESAQPIQVEGFTDNQPVQRGAYPGNWELSAARAAAVVRLLTEFGVAPQRLSAVGYGEFRPAYSNRTAEGRRKNRRVVLVVARDAQIGQLRSIYGAQQLSGATISEILPEDAGISNQPPVIEQFRTERGGMLYRQAEPVTNHAEQEQ
ncbi:OmpA family protein [Marinobacterium arenosum]|uniref:OmpA family protein n=1 Tax=Marinobacterium arenosum TaxID=2862496 RepID=UPI001C95E614|nr:flagellar motor protein MotB [Marinobacterium arenosum]MBY4675968.1 OmpA family protein [Marinobacterium arenosum]